MNNYCAHLILHGTQTWYDVDCPTRWIGSGVYDVTEEVSTRATCYVSAKTEEKARSLIEEFNFEPDDFKFTEVEIVSIFVDSPDDDYPYEEVYDVSIDRLPINDYYPEPEED